MHPLRILVVAGLLLTGATSLDAQIEDHGPTLWIGAGLGAGSAAMECRECSGGRETGTSAHLRFGAELGSAWLIGIELDGWLRRTSVVDERIHFIFGIMHFYPLANRGLWLRAGGGFTTYTALYEVDQVGTTGAAFTVGLGYELPLGLRVALEPYVTWSRQVEGELDLNSVHLQEASRLDLLQIGVGLIWRQRDSRRSRLSRSASERRHASILL